MKLFEADFTDYISHIKKLTGPMSGDEFRKLAPNDVAARQGMRAAKMAQDQADTARLNKETDEIKQRIAARQASRAQAIKKATSAVRQSPPAHPQKISTLHTSPVRKLVTTPKVSYPATPKADGKGFSEMFAKGKEQGSSLNQAQTHIAQASEAARNAPLKPKLTYKSMMADAADSETRATKLAEAKRNSTRTAMTSTFPMTSG